MGLPPSDPENLEVRETMDFEPQAPERTIGQLVADATHDLEGIVQSNIALAKAEITKGVGTLGKGAGFFGAAAFVALLGLIFLFHTIAQVLALWLPVWAGYAITMVLLFVVAGLLALLGKKTVSKAKPMPDRAIAQAQQTIESIKS